MITVITPFKRVENLPFLLKALKGKCQWVILQADDEPELTVPDWVTVKRFSITHKNHISNRLFNAFIHSGLEADTQYMILNDDDLIEEGFFDKIPLADVVCVSMKRGDRVVQHLVFDTYPQAHIETSIDILYAKPENMKLACVGGEQLIVKGKILQDFRYGLSAVGDGEMVLQIIQEYPPVYVPEAYVLFNYLEDGRFKAFRRKPLVLFIGDYYCAGSPAMGISEWETNLWKSLESTGLAEVGQFHYDKYYYHFGERGDEYLLNWVRENKPDVVVVVVYKPLGSDPTVISEEVIKGIARVSPIVSIWGDLEAEEQVILAKQVEPYCGKMFATASEEVVTSLGEKYIYMHVPKDPRIFNNPQRERDIDVLFNGSFGYGREDRREVLQYLLDNGIKLVAGGSEGGDHFTTEEYAERYKRAKIALGFSRARGRDVINARCFEAMLCGALYMVQESNEMEKLYTPFVHYVPWKDKEDLLRWIKTCLEKEDYLYGVAANGAEKTRECYSAKAFWQEFLHYIQ